MPKVIYGMGGVSADGYIVGPDGTFEWSVPDEELHRFHNEQTRALAGHLLGRRLNETMVYWETADKDPAASDVVRELALIWGAAEGGVLADPGLGRGSEHDARVRRPARRAELGSRSPRAETWRYTLEGIADRIACPTLVLEAEND